MKTDEKLSKETFDNFYKDENNWKWDIFYFNKEDKRLFPPKRYGLFGCTINFLNTKSILANLGIIFLFVIVVVYLKSR
jgi:uncharacterized membrane protein